MNFSEIFRKYDKVVESFVKKTISKTTRDIIKVADKYVRKDEEILRQLKEFIKQDGNNEEDFGFRIDLPGSWSIEQQNNEGEFEDWCIIELNLITSMVDGMYTYSVIDLGDEDSYVEVVAVSDDYAYCVSVRWEELDVKIRNGILNYLNFTDLRYDQINESFTKKIKSSRKNTLKESFTKKISSKKNTDLISKSSFVLEDGVYILHETLGVRGVEGWNPKNNDGVIGVLVVEDEHQLVVALEDSPEELQWSEDWKLINRPVNQLEDAESDFNGEEYCRNLNSPDFPADYYCLNYKKGGRDWYLPSIGELLLVRRHLEEIQSALSIVGGQKFVTDWKGVGVPLYWSSTESDDKRVWCMYPKDECLYVWKDKLIRRCKVRPVSNFCKNTLKESFTKKIKSTRKKNPLKESFTKKISSKKNTDLISEQSFVLEDGTYILHETLGVKTVEGWNPKNNDGVIGILLVEDEHQLVVALEDSPNYLIWSEEDGLVNQPIRNEKNAKSDFNGEKYCRNLNSPEYPAAYYCLNYNKGGRDWYLPSTGELWMIYQHLEEVQTALSIVGGQKFVMDWVDDNILWYWSSTEVPIFDARHHWHHAWAGCAFYSEVEWCTKKSLLNVRPVSNFCKKNTLKESFTKKIKKQTSKNVIDNVDEDIKMKSPLIFEDKEVSRVFFEEIVDINYYENGVYTLEDASIDSHEHDGYSEYFPFDNYQSNCWYNNNKIVKFNELQFFTGLKQLPDYAFVNCTSLKELTLPDNLEEIGQGAFANCISLKTVKMPKNHTLKFIEDSAFANTGLVSVVIPDGVEVIGECAFADCKYLENVVIPPSVKKIERGAFSRCHKLKTVSGIETVSKFGNDVFYGCGLGGDRLDNDVFSKCNTLRGFEKTLFSADWLDDSNVVEERFLETYCLNHYDTEDYKHITEKEWEEDEFNPNSPNFDENRFNECVWDCAYDEVSMDWNNFECDLKQLFRGHGGWVCIEDEKYFSDFSSAFDYCIPDNCEWRDLEVKQEEGSLIVCGTEIAPACDRYIEDEIDIIYPNEFIDYKSLRFCDPIEKEISL